MANQRTTRTQPQLHDDSRILLYESRNLFGAACNLTQNHVKSDTIANNAHVESFAVHCRALIHFFFGHLLLICLANPITRECLRAMIELQPQRVICLDPAFGGNDQLKTNTVLEMKSHNIEFRTV